MKPSRSPIAPVDACEACQKPQELCVCASVKKFKNKLKVLVLQHPQEPDHEIGTAWLATQCLENGKLKIGLSWPNLGKAWGDTVTPGKWGVLYLGSGPKGKAPAGLPLYCVDKKGVPLSEELNLEKLENLEGVVILDGTWSQAKALWWRNAWLLKLQRLLLAPQQGSLYRELRREPKRECLSTLESIAEILNDRGENPEIGAHLRTAFTDLLKRYRQRRTAQRTKAAAPAQ